MINIVRQCFHHSAIMPTSIWLDMGQGGKASLSINCRFDFMKTTTISIVRFDTDFPSQRNCIFILQVMASDFTPDDNEYLPTGEVTPD